MLARLQSDGTYTRVRPRKGEKQFRSQAELLIEKAHIVQLPVTVADTSNSENGSDATKNKKRARAK